jgi:hypothetical protein
MTPVSHDPKSSAAHRPVVRAAPALGLLVVGVLALAASACDIVQGYQDAGDSLFPEQSTHLASPGLRLVSGHYREIGVIGGSELFMVARGADDDTAALFVMRYAEPQPCEIASVARYSVTREPTRSAPLLSYFRQDDERRTLHFADATCKTYSLSFDDARWPVAETEQSLVVWAGSDLWLATPETGSQELLASDVTEITRGVFGGRYAVRANGRLVLFDGAWKSAGTFGDEVTFMLPVGQSLFYIDVSGVHRIVASGSDSDAFEDTLVVEDGCAMGSQDGRWVTLRSPCSGGQVLAIHEPTSGSFTLPFDANPQHLQLWPARNSPGRDPLSDPFWFFYLRSGEAEGSEDTLFVRTPAGDEHALGAHATLRQFRLHESASDADAYGYALVDVEGETGRYLWWNAAGETRALAEGAMWRADRLIVDFDGTVGNVALASGDRLRILAEGVPWQDFEYQDGTRQWTVLFHGMQDGVGRLSVLRDGLDQLASVPPEEPFVIPDLSAVASNVVTRGTASLNEVLSGVSYLRDFDMATRTGRLEYRNLELRFTAKVSEGVSDYVVANDEILYTVPYGSEAGIWLAPGK